MFMENMQVSAEVSFSPVRKNGDGNFLSSNLIKRLNHAQNVGA